MTLRCVDEVTCEAIDAAITHDASLASFLSRDAQLELGCK